MFDHKNQYPVILVPGVASYGEGASAARVAKSMGLECRLVSFGLVSGIWDRACELYAQIFGGRVDYGEAHSKKYGHSRFGKFYSGMTAKDPEKINIIAYGFGAPVARLFIDLLCNGSEEEKGATAPEELSGLFKGGNKGFVHCLVTVAGINSGITLPLALETKIPNFKKHCVKTAVYFENALSNTGYIDPYYKNNELKITQHGFSFKTVTAENGGKTKEVIDEAGVDNYLSRTEDNIFYELGIDGMERFNRYMTSSEETYYIAVAGSVTKDFFGKVTLPTLKAGACAPASLFISTFENYLPEYPIVTGEYHENDGLVNTVSSLPPVSETAASFKSADQCVPGVWYMMPVSEKNHLFFTGHFVRPDKYRNKVYDLIKLICNLE